RIIQSTENFFPEEQKNRSTNSYGSIGYVEYIREEFEFVSSDQRNPFRPGKFKQRKIKHIDYAAFEKSRIAGKICLGNSGITFPTLPFSVPGKPGIKNHPLKKAVE